MTLRRTKVGGQYARNTIALLLPVLRDRSDRGVHAAEQPTVVWNEGFEDPEPAQFALTHHNARQVSVSFAGTTAEQAAGGDHSYKIAATLAEGNYADWITKVDIPFSHPLKIRGKVRYEGEVDVQVGYYFRNVATGAGSLVRQGVKVKDLEQGWSQWECYDPGLLKSAQELRLQAVGVFVFPSAWRRPRPAAGLFQEHRRGGLCR